MKKFELGNQYFNNVINDSNSYLSFLLITSDIFVDHDVFLVNRFEQRQNSPKSKTPFIKVTYFYIKPNC